MRHGFVRSYLFSTDHKVIAKQYLFLGIFFLLLAGGMAVLIRIHLAHPASEVPVLGKWLWGGSGNRMPPEFYNMLFTNHGALMVFFAITPILIGSFGNFVIPLQIGARDMAFPVLNMLSFWVIFAGGAVMMASFLLPGGGATAGWTAYAPLSSNPAATIGWGQSLWILGIALAGTSSLMGGINYVATILNLRSPGMTLMRMPLATWGLFFTSILNILWVPVVAAALFMLLLDRVAGTSFFLAGPLAPVKGGQPLLYQHLFWGFGHPEVYILILPVWGLVGDLLSIFSRKPAFGYKATVLSMATITALSSIVWGHHMFTSGMSPLLGQAFVLLTITISVPTAVFFLNWLATLWRGSIRMTVPMLFALGIVFVFAIGGLTGLFNALQALDIYIHDTYFVVGHFHYTLAASVLFGAYAGIYYWFPKMFGRTMSSAVGVLHFVLTFVLLNVIFSTMFYVGIGGHPRRIANPATYQFLDRYRPANVLMGHATTALGLAQLLFVGNFVYGIFWGRKAARNPWEAASLEWTVDAPIPHGNFPEPPVVRHGPHEFGAPGAGARGWLMQNEEAPAAG
jgi:cytochrome c oxidase subunit 1